MEHLNPFQNIYNNNAKNHEKESLDTLHTILVFVYERMCSVNGTSPMQYQQLSSE